jgi:hypothetical protein
MVGGPDDLMVRDCVGERGVDQPATAMPSTGDGRGDSYRERHAACWATPVVA